MTWEEIKLQASERVRQLMIERHVSLREVKQVIYHAETNDEKLYLPGANRYLAKLTMGSSTAQATFYAEYSIEGQEYIVRSAYAHKSQIKE